MGKRTFGKEEVNKKATCQKEELYAIVQDYSEYSTIQGIVYIFQSGVNNININCKNCYESYYSMYRWTQ